MPKKETSLLKPVETRILVLRGQKVNLDADLADLYEVPVKRLNQQVKRNAERFPADFLLQLTPEEYEILRSQIATSRPGSGGRRYLPYAFTEHGTIMAATVLNSQRAIEMSVFVVRVFVRLRELLSSNRELAEKVTELDRRLKTHDGAIRQIIEAIKELTSPSTTHENRSDSKQTQNRKEHLDHENEPQNKDEATSCQRPAFPQAPNERGHQSALRAAARFRGSSHSLEDSP